MSQDNKYNGWTNYATWRVNLEMFDGFDPYDYFDAIDPNQISELGEELKAWAEDYISNSSDSGLARDYALAFLSDVNWYEIAKNMIENYYR